MVCPRGDRPALRHGGPLCRTRDREDEFSLSASLSSLARQPSGCPVTEPRPAGKNALLCAVPCRCARCPAGFGRPGVAASLRPYAPRSWPGCSCSPAITDGTAHVCSRKFAVPLLLILLSYHGDAVRCPPAVRQAEERLTRAASPAAVLQRKKRRPPAWRPADVRSRFTDVACGIRTACRAGKRWPRNRRPARRHCSTGHGSGS